MRSAATNLVIKSVKRKPAGGFRFNVDMSVGSVRCLSGGAANKSFRDTLERMKKERGMVDGETGSEKIAKPSKNVNADTEEKPSNATSENVEEAANKSEKVDNIDETGAKENPSAEKEPSRFTWNEVLSSISTIKDAVVAAVQDAVKEKPPVEKSYLRRKIHQAVTFRRAGEELAPEDGEPSYTGPTTLVVSKEPQTPWEAMKARLGSSPLLHDIMRRTQRISKAASETTIGKHTSVVGQKVGDKLHDLREYWETTQNPIVYSVAGVWENMTGETEEAQCIRDFLKLDPNFSKEEWCKEMETELVPNIIKGLLTGNINEYRGILGEAVYNKLLADIRQRKTDGHVFDPNVLNVEERQCVMKYPEGAEGAYIICHYAVQQINCVKNREGEIIEGAESDVRMRVYTFLFNQSIEEVKSTVDTDKGKNETVEHWMVWKVVDMQFGEMVPYF